VANLNTIAVAGLFKTVTVVFSATIGASTVSVTTSTSGVANPCFFIDCTGSASYLLAFRGAIFVCAAAA
jgi:hypothetical protein